MISPTVIIIKTQNENEYRIGIRPKGLYYHFETNFTAQFLKEANSNPEIMEFIIYEVKKVLIKASKEIEK